MQSRTTARKLIRVIQVLAVLFLAFALPLGAWAGYLQIGGNIHAVTPGVMYRSAQLSSERLDRTLKQFDIKSVINLRGSSETEDWYSDELKIAAAQGAQHFDLAMDAKAPPDAQTIARMFELLKTAPKPMLIHCNRGADRSGLVAAVYKHFIEGQSPDEAARQLSFRYGHFPWLGTGTQAMDDTFARLISSEANVRPSR